MSKRAVIVELWSYLAAEKKYWLLPLALLLALTGIFIAVSQSSVAASFIYTLF